MLFEYKTDRLILKILSPEAAPMVLDFYLRDQELFERYEPKRSENFYTIMYQHKLLRCEYNLAFKKTSIRYYIFLKEDPNTIIGTVSILDIKNTLYSSCQIGYKFSSQYQHMGYASEAVERIIDMVFHDLNLHRINAWVLPDNMPSIHLLQRMGFEWEGLCRGFLLLNGNWMDHLQYSLLNPYMSNKQNQ